MQRTVIRDDGEEVTETVWEDDGAGSPAAAPAPAAPASAKACAESAQGIDVGIGCASGDARGVLGR